MIQRTLAKYGADAHGEYSNPMLTIENGRIICRETWTAATRLQSGDIDAREWLMLPGFIDIHIHGGAGYNIMAATRQSPDPLLKVADHLSSHGVTSFLATTVTAPWENIQQTMDVVQTVMKETPSTGAGLLGCHLEGPYINPEKKGAQPEAFIRLPNADEFLEKTGGNLNVVKIVTLAPEMEGAENLLRLLTALGIVPSIGHTDAAFAQIERAVALGARHVTHCFNAMTGLGSREPGVVGAAMSMPELTAELIWDNIHVHPASCRALIEAKGPEGVLFISDGIPGAGMPDGYSFSLGDTPVTVQGGAARLPDGVLAGSLLTLDRAFENAGIFSLSNRSRMASYNPAMALGLRKGLLTPGWDADFTLMDSTGTVQSSFVMGREVYRRD